MSREHFNSSVRDAEKREESRRLCMVDQDTVRPLALPQRACDHHEEFLEERAEGEHYRHQYIGPPAKLLKVDLKYKNYSGSDERSVVFEHLPSGSKCRGLKRELLRAMSAREDWKKLYLQLQSGFLRVRSLWGNMKRQLECTTAALENRSSFSNDSNARLRDKITKLSLVLGNLRFQAEVSQEEGNSQSFFKPNRTISKEALSVELEQDEDRRCVFSDAEVEDQYVPQVRNPDISFEINSGSWQEENFAGRSQNLKDSNFITADTKSEVSFLRVQGRCDTTLEVEDPDCELEQIIALEQRHATGQRAEYRRLGVPEEEEQSVLLLQEHCNYETGLLKETTKKVYYKRQCLSSQAELFELYSNRKTFNIRAEEKRTQFENVSSMCITLQREIVKVESEKEYYMNQCLQFKAVLLRVHSMWTNLKPHLEIHISEFQSVSSWVSHGNADLARETDRLSFALDELLAQVEGSEENRHQAQDSLQPNKKNARRTPAEFGQTEHRRYTILDSEDDQRNVPQVQDHNVSLETVAPGSAQQGACAATTEELKDTDCVDMVAQSEEFVVSQPEKNSAPLDSKAPEREQEQTSGLDGVLLQDREETEQSKDSQSLCAAQAEIAKLLSLQQRNCDLEAELLNERGKNDYYKNLCDQSQAELLELRAMRDNFHRMSLENNSAPLDSKAPEREQEQTSGLDGVLLQDREDTEQSKDSQSLCAAQAEITRLSSLQQRVCDLETELCIEKSGKDYYSKLYNEAQAELLAMRATQEIINQKDEESQTVAENVSSFENDSHDDVNEIIKALLEAELVSLQGRNCDLEAELLIEKGQKDYYKNLCNESQAGLWRLHAVLDSFDQKSEEKTTEPDVNESIRSVREASDTLQFPVEVMEKLAERIKKLIEPKETSPKDTFASEVEEITASESVPEEASPVTPTSSISLDIEGLKCQQEQISALEDELLESRHDTEQNVEPQTTCTLEAETAELLSLQQRNCDLEAELLNEKGQKDNFKTLCDESQAELLKLRAVLDSFNQRSEEKTTEMDVDESIRSVREASDALELQVEVIEELVEKLKKLSEPKETNPKDVFALEVEKITASESVPEEASTVTPTSNTTLDIEGLKCQQEQISALEDELLESRHDTEQNVEPQTTCASESETAELFSLQRRNCDLEAELLNEKGQKDYYKNLCDESQAELLELRAMRDNFNQMSLERNSAPLDSKAPEREQEQTSGLDGVLLQDREDTGQGKDSQSLCAAEAEITTLSSLQQRVCDLESELSEEKHQKDYYNKLCDELQAELLALRATQEIINQEAEERQNVAENVCSCGNDSHADVNENIKAVLEATDALEFQVEVIDELAEKLKKLSEPKETNPKDVFPLEVEKITASESVPEEASAATPTSSISLDIEGLKCQQEQISALEDELLESRHDTEQNVEPQTTCTLEAETAELLSLQQRNCDLEAELLNEKGQKDYYKTLCDESQAELLKLRAVLDSFNQRSEEKTTELDVNESIRSVRKASDALELQVEVIEELAEKLKKFSEPKETNPKDAFPLEVEEITASEPVPEEASAATPTSSTTLDIEGLKCQQEQISALEDELLEPRHDTEQNVEPQTAYTSETEIAKLLSLQQRNCNLEAELLNERGKNDYYKNLWDKSQAELLELRAMRDNFNRMSLENNSAPLDSKAPEREQEQTSGLDGVLLQDREETEQSKDSQSLCASEAEKAKLLSLQQRNCDLKAELLNEKGEKDYYKNLCDESQAELLKLRAVLDSFNQRSEEKTTELDVNESIRSVRKASDALELQVEVIEELAEKLKKFSEPKETNPKDAFPLEVEEITASEPVPEEASAATPTSSTTLDIEGLKCQQEQISALEDELLKPRHDTEQNWEPQTAYTSEAEIAKLFCLQPRDRDRALMLLTKYFNERYDKNYYKNLWDKSQAKLLELRAMRDNFNLMSLENNSAPLDCKVPEREQEQTSDLDGVLLQDREDTEPSKDSQSLCAAQAETAELFSLQQGNCDPEAQLLNDLLNMKGQKDYYQNLCKESRAELLKLRAMRDNFNRMSLEKNSAPLDSKAPEREQEQTSGLDGVRLQEREDTEQSKDSQSLCASEAETGELLSLQQSNCDLEAELLNEKGQKDYYKNLYDDSQAELIKLRAVLDSFNQRSEEKTTELDVNENIRSVREASDALELQVQVIEELAEKLKKFSEPKETNPKDAFPLEVEEITASEPVPEEASAATPTSSTTLDIEGLKCQQEQFSALEDELLEPRHDTEQNWEPQTAYTSEAETAELFCLQPRDRDRALTLLNRLFNEKYKKDYFKNLWDKSQAELLELRAMRDNFHRMSLENNSAPLDSKAPEREQEQTSGLDGVLLQDREETEQSKDSQSLCAAQAETAELFSLQQGNSEVEAELLNDLVNVKGQKDYYINLCKKSRAELLELRAMRDNFNRMSLEKNSAPLDSKAPEREQEQTSGLDGVRLQDREETEQSKDSQSLCAAEAETAELFSLQQRNCYLETELSEEKHQKDYYNKICFELQADLLVIQESINIIPKDEENLSVAENVCSSGNDDHDNVNENIKNVRKASGALQFQVEVIEDCLEVNADVGKEKHSDTLIEADSQETESELVSANAAVETAIPEEETPETENHEIGCLPISDMQPENFEEKHTGSILLPIPSPETGESGVFSAWEEFPEQNHDTFFEPECESADSDASLEVLKLDVQTQTETGYVDDQEAVAPQGQSSHFWRRPAQVLTHVFMTFGFSLFGAYIYQSANNNSDLTDGLYHLLERFCPFENASPFPF